MRALIHSILIYIVLVTVLKNLIASESYRQYFKFFCGIILILIMTSPLLNFLSGDNDWYEMLEKYFVSQDMEQVNAELKVSDGKFENVLIEECSLDIENQVRELADKDGIDVDQVDVSMSIENDEMELQNIDITLKQDGDSGGESDAIVVDKIQVVDNDEEDKKSDGESESDSVSAQKLKKSVSDYLQIRESKVCVWE